MRDRVVQFPNRFRLTPVDGQPGVYDITLEPGEVTEEGTPYNKATQLNDETAGLLGLSEEEAVVDKALGRIADKLKVPRYKLLQSYTEAGTYTWTAPDLFNGRPYTIGVYIIGAGGAGAGFKLASTSTSGSMNYRASGGASGYTETIIVEVVPGQTYSVVVGKGGVAEIITGGKGPNGEMGGSSAFNGIVAPGGEGGYTDGGGNNHFTRGADGGQGSDAQPSSRGTTAFAPALGELTGLGTPDGSNGGQRGSSIFSDTVNTLGGLRYLSAGGGVNGNSEGSPGAAQPGRIMPDGLMASSGAIIKTLNLDAVATTPTSPGCGGGSAGIRLHTTGGGSGIAYPASGADGAVFIYV